MKALFGFLLLATVLNTYASDIVLHPDGKEFEINGATVSCTGPNINIQVSKLTDEGVLVLAASDKLGKCKAYTFLNEVSFSVNGGTVFNEKNPISNESLKRVANMIKDSIKMGLCEIK